MSAYEILKVWFSTTVLNYVSLKCLSNGMIFVVLKSDFFDPQCALKSVPGLWLLDYSKKMWCCSVAWSDVTVFLCWLLFSLCHRACDIMARFENNSTGVCDVRASRSTCVLLDRDIQETSKTGFYDFTFPRMTRQPTVVHALLSICHHVAGLGFSSGLECICVFSLNHNIIEGIVRLLLTYNTGYTQAPFLLGLDNVVHVWMHRFYFNISSTLKGPILYKVCYIFRS